MRVKNVAVIVVIAICSIVRFGNAGSLVGRWQFDEGIGTTTEDTSGDGHSGTLEGICEWVGGEHGKSIDFGSGGVVSIPAEVFSDIYNAITVTMWVNRNEAMPEKTEYNERVFGSASGSGIGVVLINIKGELNWIGADQVVSGPLTSDEYTGRWNHWAFTKNAIDGTMKIYVNGVLRGEGNGLTKSIDGIKGGQFLIGNKGNGFKGRIDDVRIYSYVLSNKEIAEQAHAKPDISLEQGLNDIKNSNLIAWLKFDEKSGNFAMDYSGHNSGGAVLGAKRADGKIDGALSFNGSDYVLLRPRGVLSNINQMTFTLWQYASPEQQAKSGILFVAYSETDNTILEGVLSSNNGINIIWTGGSAKDSIFTKISENKNYKKGWNHWAFTKSTETGVMKIYLNGVECRRDTEKWLPLTGLSHVTISSSEAPYMGLIDDFRIYNYALSDAEIARLVSSVVEKDWDQKTEEEIEKSASNANKFFEGKVFDYNEKRIRGDAEGVISLPILYFELARAKEAAGVSIQEIVDTYKKSIASDSLSLSKQGDALFWIYNNQSPEQYRDIIQSLVNKDSDYLRGISAKAEMMMQGKKIQEAVRFLESNLSIFTYCINKHPISKSGDYLPELYFQLGKAREASGAAKKDVADAYTKTFIHSSRDYWPAREAALIWLQERDSHVDYRDIVNMLILNYNTKESFKKAIQNICRQLELRGDKPQYMHFMDKLLDVSEYPYEAASIFESCYGIYTDRWNRKELLEYFGSKPCLKFYKDYVIAKRYEDEKIFKKAAELYLDIVNRCGVGDDKEKFEYHYYKCLFYANEYQQALSKIENFIDNQEKTNNPKYLKDAILLKGLAYVQLGEPDKAIEIFFRLVTEYPKAEEIAEINYFIGYCYMLQGEFEKATKAFNNVTVSYPQSNYADKAKLYLKRIDSMAK